MKPGKSWENIWLSDGDYYGYLEKRERRSYFYEVEDVNGCLFDISPRKWIQIQIFCYGREPNYGEKNSFNPCRVYNIKL